MILILNFNGHEIFKNCKKNYLNDYDYDLFKKSLKI